jgi:hypothetical protein
LSGTGKTKAAEAMGFRGLVDLFPHLWGHSLDGARPSDFKSARVQNRKNFSTA